MNSYSDYNDTTDPYFDIYDDSFDEESDEDELQYKRNKIQKRNKRKLSNG